MKKINYELHYEDGTLLETFTNLKAAKEAMQSLIRIWWIPGFEVNEKTFPIWIKRLK